MKLTIILLALGMLACRVGGADYYVPDQGDDNGPDSSTYRAARTRCAPSIAQEPNRAWNAPRSLLNASPNPGRRGS